MREFYAECARLLSEGEDVVVATIVRKSGSAPRSTGAKMLIRRDGWSFGTVGGGALEAHVLKEAAGVFESGYPVWREFHLTGADAASMEMICGGRVDAHICQLSASHPQTLAIYDAARRVFDGRGAAALVTALDPPSADGGVLVRQCLLLDDGSTLGDAPSAADLQRLRSVAVSGTPALVETGGHSFLAEPVGASGALFIFGAGHISQQLAGLASAAGFYTVVIDDREEYATRKRFPLANEVVVTADYGRCLEGLPVSPHSFLVIVTQGHRHDHAVLEQALRTNAGYIGMIGSLRKRNLTYDALRDSGVTDAELNRVHSPIGIDIHAETPEEIAISIVAELIRARAEGRRG